MKTLLITFVLFNFLIAQKTFSQEIQVYKNEVYKENIKTILFYKKGWEFTYPVMNLNSSEKLILQFDDLNEEITDYSYTIIHCNSDWTESGLNPLEYISGFTEDQITEFEPSFNTLVPYNHYEISFPNENIRPILSGNYSLIVYEDYDSEKIVFTRCFMIVDEKVKIESSVKRSTIVNTSNTSQEISFNIIDKNSIIKNAFDNLNVVISQNNRRDNIISGLKPDFIKGKIFEFYNPRKIRFSGGNEYRYFNTKSFKLATEKVHKIDFISPYYFYELYTEKTESYLPYSYIQDLNGGMLIVADNVFNNVLEANYVYVDFSLQTEELINKGDFYVFGELSDWKLSKKSKMSYNYGTNCYELRMLLKQGFYNYEYVYADSLNAKIDNTKIEGSHYETENNYMIFIYYRKQGDDYDGLIGFQLFNSYTKL